MNSPAQVPPVDPGVRALLHVERAQTALAVLKWGIGNDDERVAQAVKALRRERR